MKKACLKRVTIAMVLALALLSGCASTKIIDSWRDEGYSGRPAKVLLLAVAKERGPRTLMEEEFARQLKAHGVESFLGTTIFPEEGLPSKDAVLAKAEELKPEAVLVIRFLKKTTGDTSAPVRRYAVPTGFATSWEGYAGSPTSMTSYTDVGIRDISYGFYYATLETTLYDMKTQNPLWSAYTSTKYEDHPLKQIGSFAKTIVHELDKTKLLPKR
jgi:hypothetical protein